MATGFEGLRPRRGESSACYGRRVRITVVIPAKNEAQRIESAIASARDPAVRVIVADGDSSDDTVLRARRSGAEVVKSAPGRARQLAAGAAAVEAQAEVILFLHADTRLPLGFAAAVAAALSDPDVAGGAFEFRFDAGAARLSPSLRLVEWGARLRNRILGYPFGDQAIFLRRTDLDEMGGVPQSPLMEDLDLVRGIKRRGRLTLLPNAAFTSPRRYLEQGVWRTVGVHLLAQLGYALGMDRDRLAAWYRR